MIQISYQREITHNLTLRKERDSSFIIHLHKNGVSFWNTHKHVSTHMLHSYTKTAMSIHNS